MPVAKVINRKMLAMDKFEYVLNVLYFSKFLSRG